MSIFKKILQGLEEHSVAKIKELQERESITKDLVKQKILFIGSPVMVSSKVENLVKWDEEGKMNDVLGKTGVVSDISKCSVSVSFGDGEEETSWNFDVECLDKCKTKLLPFTVEDAGDVAEQWVRQKGTDKESKIIGISNEGITYANHSLHFWSWDAAKNSLEFRSGAPFGKEVIDHK